MKQFEEIFKNRHAYARVWKERTGGKVLGYFCTYFPEEIAYAAGILPVHILGSHEPQDISERYIYSMFCPFCRDCLAQGLNSIAMANSCNHIRQAYASWYAMSPLKMASISFYLCPQNPIAQQLCPF